MRILAISLLVFLLWSCQPVKEKVVLSLEKNTTDFVAQTPHGFSGIQSLEDKREPTDFTETYGHRLVPSENGQLIKQASLTLTASGFKSSLGGQFYMTSSVHSAPDGEIPHTE